MENTDEIDTVSIIVGGIALFSLGCLAGFMMGRKTNAKREEELINDFNRIVKKSNNLADFIDQHDFYKIPPKSEIVQKIEAYKAQKKIPRVIEKEETDQDGATEKVYVDVETGAEFRVM